MPNLNNAIVQTLSRIPGISPGFLSSLNALGQQTQGNGLFDDLLKDIRAQSPRASTQANASSSTGNATPTNGSPTSALGAAPSYKDIIHAMKDFLQKWRAFEHSNQSAAKPVDARAKTQAQTQTQTPATPAATTQTTATPADASPQTNGSNTDTTTDRTQGSTDSTATASKVPSIDDLLAALQNILQMIQQNFQADQKTQGTAANATATDPAQVSTDASNADGTQTPAPAQGDAKLLTAAELMTDLVMLVQHVEKKLLAASDAGGTPAANPTATANATQASVTALNAQLKTDVKNLLDQLKTSLTANAGDQPGGQQTTDTQSNADNAAAASIPATQGTPTTAAAGASGDITKNALAAADDFLKQLNNLFGRSDNNQAATTGFATAAASFMPSTGDKGDASFTASDSNRWADANSSTATSTTDASALGTMTDGKSTSPYNFASQLSAVRAENGGTTGLPSAIEQVIFQLSRNIKNGSDQMTLQLAPAELGRINIKLDISSDGKVQGTVIADNPATLDLLLKDVRSLERALQDAGLRADSGSLQFSLGDQTGQMPGQSAGDNASGSSNAGGTASPSDASTTLAADTGATTESWYVTPGRVNLKV